MALILSNSAFSVYFVVINMSHKITLQIILFYMLFGMLEIYNDFFTPYS